MLRNRTQLGDLYTMSAAQVARLPIEDLAILLDEIGTMKAGAL